MYLSNKSWFNKTDLQKKKIKARVFAFYLEEAEGDYYQLRDMILGDIVKHEREDEFEVCAMLNELLEDLE